MAIPEARNLSYQGANLPQVTEADDGKVLGVVGGKWVIKKDKDSELPVPTAADVGKAPLANANGGYTLTDLGPGISYEVVSELPSTGEVGVIYLVANGAQTGTNIYDEYIWTGSGYEKIGSTETPNNVLIIDLPYNNYSAESRQQNAAYIETIESSILSAYSSNKAVVISEPSSSEEKKYYYVTAIDTTYDSRDSLAISAVGNSSNSSFLSWLYYGHKTESPYTPELTKTTFRLADYDSVPLAQAQSIDSNYYKPVIKQTGQANKGYLYVDRSGEVPDVGVGLEGSVLGCYDNAGTPSYHWADIETGSFSLNSGDLYNLIMHAIMVAESAGTATVGVSGTTVYSLVSLFLSFLNQKNEYTGETLFVNFGKYNGKVVGNIDTDITVKCAGYDTTNDYFVEFTLVLGVDTSGGTGNETGYFCVHATATQPTPPPTM